jgi:regulator of sigma E protease
MPVEFIAALDWQTLWWWIDVIVKVAVALGAVVFVHELGHFLLAKACGVKVEKFMIGFDIGGYKISRRWGETVYGIGILPLGGYVKMFGQDDDPSHIAEQMQKSQVAAGSSDAVEKVGPNGETYYIDRRSYLAKSVPQRMAIISAGVIMNVIFAFIFAAIAYGMGVRYLPCIVSETMPGSPAWQRGIEPGDEIVRLGERDEPTFMQLKGSVTLGNLETGIPIEVRRAATGEVVPISLLPNLTQGELATVGIITPQSLELWKDEPVIKGSAAAVAKLISPSDSAKKDDEKKLASGDTIVSVNEVPVENYRQYVAELVKATDKPLVVEVRRKLTDAEGNRPKETGGAAEKTELLTFEVPPQPMRDLGLVMNMGPIAAVQDDSPAKQAGMKPGDVIETVDGEPIANSEDTLEGWTPATLPEYLHKAAVEGRDVEFGIRRKADGKSESEQLTIHIKPIVPVSIHTTVPIGAPLSADAAGIAYHIENTVHAVSASGPAASEDLAAGDRITAARLILPRNEKGKIPDPVDVKLGAEHLNWGALVNDIQFVPTGTRVELEFVRGNEKELRKAQIKPGPASGVFIAPRGFVFEPVYRTRTASTFSEAVRFGLDETTDALTMVFRFLQKLGGQVPLKMLGGPGTIAVAAGDAASHGLSSLLIFLTMLSANLAVINFLPIPLLDGGHMMFLTYEGLRGRPANEKVVLGLHMAGFVFIIGLMVFVIGLDIQRWILT